MNAFEDNLLEALRPVVDQLVREAFARELHPWQWASIRQAAEVLDISEGAVKARLKRRQLPSVVLEGRRYIDLKELDRQLREATAGD